MPPEEAVAKSPLEKPLHQLTEDDIAQLTREDCRRYLKEKGMRRPSWNKSQAIQQVISLKKLLETTSCDVENKKLYNNNSLHVARNVSVNARVSESADKRLSLEDNDTEHSIPIGDFPSRVSEAAENESAPDRATVSREVPVQQMAIFYCGKVNVYDGMPADKAQAIMHLAASPLHIPQDAPCDGNMGMLSSARQLQVAGARGGSESVAKLQPAPLPVRTSENPRLYGEANSSFLEDNPVECQASRKASVQRYLEKRKDRFKSKRKAGINSSSSVDIYFDHQMGNQTLNEHTSRSNACSPPQIRPPNTPTRSSSPENYAASRE